MRFGVTLSNRGILPGLTTMPKLLALADAVRDPMAIADRQSAVSSPHRCPRSFIGTGGSADGRAGEGGVRCSDQAVTLPTRTLV
jgi:hypothetical protein